MVHLDVSLGEILLLVFAWHFFTPIFTWFGVLLTRKIKRRFSPSTQQLAPRWGRYILFADLEHHDETLDGMVVEVVGFEAPELAEDFKERIRQTLTS